MVSEQICSLWTKTTAKNFVKNKCQNIEWRVTHDRIFCDTMTPTPLPPFLQYAVQIVRRAHISVVSIATPNKLSNESSLVMTSYYMD